MIFLAENFEEAAESKNSVIVRILQVFLEFSNQFKSIKIPDEIPANRSVTPRPPSIRIGGSAARNPHVNADGVTVYTLILDQVLTGRSKDFGSSWAPDLSLEPTGYHSVCGPESDQKVPPVVSRQTLR